MRSLSICRHILTSTRPFPSGRTNPSISLKNNDNHCRHQPRQPRPVVNDWAADLWDEIDNCNGDVDLTGLLERQLDIQNATEAKVDAISWVAEQLKLDLETWEARLESIVALHSQAIEKRRNQLKQLKAYLLRLHNLGLLGEQVFGVERRIDFQNNTPSVVLLVEPEQLPQQFQEIAISAKSKNILAAHKAGVDDPAIAQIVTGKHVRFRHLSTKSKRSQK